MEVVHDSSFMEKIYIILNIFSHNVPINKCFLSLILSKYRLKIIIVIYSSKFSYFTPQINKQ